MCSMLITIIWKQKISYTTPSSLTKQNINKKIAKMVPDEGDGDLNVDEEDNCRWKKCVWWRRWV